MHMISSCECISRVVENGWYFKRDDSASSSAEPNGSLRKKVLFKAIELANTEVTKLTQDRPCGRGPYVYLTGAPRYK